MWSLNPKGRTIAVVFISGDETTRRDAENVLAKDLTARNARGVAAGTLLPNERREDGEAALAELKRAGVNGVVVMRVIANDQGTRYALGYGIPAYQWGFARYWEHGWSTLREPRDLKSDTPLSIETRVYSLDQAGRLVWASTSGSIDPSDLYSSIGEAAAATTREMFQPHITVPLGIVQGVIDPNSPETHPLPAPYSGFARYWDTL